MLLAKITITKTWKPKSWCIAPDSPLRVTGNTVVLILKLEFAKPSPFNITPAKWEATQTPSSREAPWKLTKLGKGASLEEVECRPLLFSGGYCASQRTSRPTGTHFIWPLNLTVIMIPFGHFLPGGYLRDKETEVQGGYVLSITASKWKPGFRPSLLQFLCFSVVSRLQRLLSSWPATWTIALQLWTHPPTCLLPASHGNRMDGSFLLLFHVPPRGQRCCEYLSSPALSPPPPGASGIADTYPGARYYCDGSNSPPPSLHPGLFCEMCISVSTKPLLSRCFI